MRGPEGWWQAVTMNASLACRGNRQWRWPGVVVVCAAAVASCGVTGASGAPGRSPAASAGLSVRAAGGPSLVLGYRLNAVAALSAASAWAVGLSSQGIVHPIRWDGRSWQRVPVSGDGDLYGVAAISAADAWAVGYGPDGTSAWIEHWNGAAWTPVAAPSTGGPAILHAVGAVSPSDVWAVGGANPAGKTVILRWNGTAWARVSSPTPPGASSELNGVAATSATNAWAVGDTGTTTRQLPLIEHWDGTAWRQVPSPS